MRANRYTTAAASTQHTRNNSLSRAIDELKAANCLLCVIGTCGALQKQHKAQLELHLAASLHTDTAASCAAYGRPHMSWQQHACKQLHYCCSINTQHTRNDSLSRAIDKLKAAIYLLTCNITGVQRYNMHMINRSLLNRHSRSS